MLITLHDLLGESARRFPERPALTYRDETLSYAALWEQVRCAATGLIATGVRKGDRVAIFLEKRLETVVAAFAVSAAGGVLVPVNPVLRAPQVAHILTDSGARTLITSRQRLAALNAEPAGLAEVATIVLVDQPPAESAAIPWSGLLAGTPGRLPGGIDLDLAAILYTSGSTGRPKGVVLSHRNMVTGALSVSDYLGNSCDDVILSVLPLSFDAGFSQLTTAFAVGAQVVLLNYLLPADVVKQCERHGVTGITCVPPLWIQIAQANWSEAAASRLRYFANTGGRMPKTTLDQLRGLFPQAAPYLMYGLTEAFRSTYLDPAEIDRRPYSIGKAIPNAEILVVGPDGTACGPGEEGELVHRGALVALGYWNDPVRTAERFRPVPGVQPQWRQEELAVWSGDTVTMDEEGFLYFVGRDDEMIKTSGYRVSPTEIEEAAYRTGLVKDAVAFGVPDEVLGQRIMLIIAATQESVQAADVIAALSAALPRFMVPGQVDLRAALPRSPNGKFDRAALRQEYA